MSAARSMAQLVEKTGVRALCPTVIALLFLAQMPISLSTGQFRMVSDEQNMFTYPVMAKNKPFSFFKASS